MRGYPAGAAGFRMASGRRLLIALEREAELVSTPERRRGGTVSFFARQPFLLRSLFSSLASASCGLRATESVASTQPQKPARLESILAIVLVSRTQLLLTIMKQSHFVTVSRKTHMDCPAGVYFLNIGTEHWSGHDH